MQKMYTAFSAAVSWVASSWLFSSSAGGSAMPVRPESADRCRVILPDAVLPDRTNAAKALASRSVQAPATPAATVPTATEVTDVLSGQGLDLKAALQLGIAMDVPARFLLAQVPAHDPRQHLTAVLQTACPLTPEQLARALESDSVGGFHLADHIRQLAHDHRLPEQFSPHNEALHRMVELLLPIADRYIALGECLDLSLAELNAINSAIPRPRDSADTALRAVIEKACAAQGRSREQWLMALVQAQVDWRTVEKVANAWQMPLPTGYPSWAHWCRRHTPDSFRLARNIVLQHQRNPEAAVPLSQLCSLTCSQGYRSAFALALDDPMSYHWRSRMMPDPELAGVVSLLHHAADQGCEGVRWDNLQKLAQFTSVSPALAQQLPEAAPAVATESVETASRRLRPSDLLRLVKGHRMGTVKEGLASEREAFEVAALLGIAINYEAMQCDFDRKPPAERALFIWHRIYSHMPELETGHLVELFRRGGRPDLVERLTGDRNSQMMPSCSLEPLFSRADDFHGLARQLWDRPQWATAFMAAEKRQNASATRPEGRFAYAAPAGVGQACQLLNGLAMDSCMRQRALDFFENRWTDFWSAPLTIANPHPEQYDCALRI